MTIFHRLIIGTSLFMITLFIITLLCYPSYLGAHGAQDITSVKELREILSQRKPLCIMFYAPWCSACKSMKEPFDKAADELKKDVLLIKVDADNKKFKETADCFGIEAIPTIIFKHVGVLDKDQLVTAIKTIERAPVRTKKPAPPIKKPAPQTTAPKKPVKKAQPQATAKKTAPAAQKAPTGPKKVPLVTNS